MAKEKIEVDIIDDDHIWIKGQQYVSLNRFIEVKNESAKELKNFKDKVEILQEENNALRVFSLKDKITTT